MPQVASVIVIDSVVVSRSRPSRPQLQPPVSSDLALDHIREGI